MYTCPKCKSKIQEKQCTMCSFNLKYRNGIPVFFSDSPISTKYKEIGAFYDSLYTNVDDAWNVIASRGSKIIEYIAQIISSDLPERYLDIGCGEGYLLSAVEAKDKYGIDISQKALEITAERSKSNVCIGFAEEIPFPDNYFDTISSIGVMTHFIDDINATKEINRILKVGGKYILGIYLRPPLLLSFYSIIKKVKIEIKDPLNLIKLSVKKIMKKINRKNRTQQIVKQPVEIFYSEKELIKILNNCGFNILETITKRNNPEAPLAGDHFNLYILKSQNC